MQARFSEIGLQSSDSSDTSSDRISGANIGYDVSGADTVKAENYEGGIKLFVEIDGAPRNWSNSSTPSGRTLRSICYA